MYVLDRPSYSVLSVKIISRDSHIVGYLRLWCIFNHAHDVATVVFKWLEDHSNYSRVQILRSIAIIVYIVVGSSSLRLQYIFNHIICPYIEEL